MGVPEIFAVLLLKVRPFGRLPSRVQVRGEVPLPLNDAVYLLPTVAGLRDSVVIAGGS